MEERAVGRKSVGGDTIGGPEAWALDSGPAVTSCSPVDKLLTGLVQKVVSALRDIWQTGGH